MQNEPRSFPLLGALTALIAGLAPLVKEISSLVAAAHPSQTAIAVAVQNVGASWVCGTKQLSGMSPCPPTSLPPSPQGQTQTSSSMPKPPPSRFPNKTLGWMEQQIPISRTAWTLQATEIPRVVHFDMRVEACASRKGGNRRLFDYSSTGRQVCLRRPVRQRRCALGTCSPSQSMR